MIISEDKKFWLWKRRTDLELLATALRVYARTKDTAFLELAKEFGRLALDAKKKIEKYTSN